MVSGALYEAINPGQTIWKKKFDHGIIIHAQYADDFLHFTDNHQLYVEFCKDFQKTFNITSGPVDAYLGNKIKFDTERQEVNLNQTEYAKEVLGRFGFENSHPVTTPITDRLTSIEELPLSAEEHSLYRNCIGSLLYLACWTRPDISFAVSELSRFVSKPCVKHWDAAKHLMRYIKGTLDFGIKYTKPNSTGNGEVPNVLWGYVDSDWAGCPDSRRSTSGYVLMLNGAAISWKSKRQTVVALSSAEAEYISASSLVQEVIYVRRLLENLGFPQTKPTTIYEDNSTCIAWSEGAVVGSDKAKHIDLRVHYVHEAVEQKIISLSPIASSKNAADLLTKPLPRQAVVDLRKKILGL